MKELHELKEKLCDELKVYGKKEMSAGSLDVIDKLAHAVKNIDKIIENYEDEGYSNRMYSNEGRSYARGRGSNANRDARGRYSTRQYNSRNSYDGYSYNDEMPEPIMYQ